MEPTDDGVLLRLPRRQARVYRISRIALDDLVGWVAGGANHERSKRKSTLLNDIADEMEAALARAK